MDAARRLRGMTCRVHGRNSRYSIKDELVLLGAGTVEELAVVATGAEVANTGRTQQEKTKIVAGAEEVHSTGRTAILQGCAGGAIA